MTSSGIFPVISGGVSTLGYINKYNRNENTITVSQYGTAGYVDFQTEKFWANDVCYCFYPNQFIVNKYLYYCLLNKQTYIYKLTTKAVPDCLPLSKLQNVLIPLPSLEVQNYIVELLDRFDKLCNDISNGLPAEIEARTKQYEFYRDKLLSFKEL